MGSNGSDEAIVHGNMEAECSDTTVEIKIKTLDSQTYTLRVDKCVPVPALKEQIENVTGVLSNQQRLICQGKVLKDDQLLSAYHVEDGHTLHLVVRQPPSSSVLQGTTGSESALNQPDSDSIHVGRNFVLGHVNLADRGDISGSDLSQILSSVFSSFGINNVGLGNERNSERSGTAPANGGYSDSSQSQIDQTFARAGLNQQHASFQFPSAFPLGNQAPAVIPDSLTTISQYLAHMNQEFDANVRVLTSNLQAANSSVEEQSHSSPSNYAPRQGGLPTLASLAEIILSARQLLMTQAGGCLFELATLLQEEERVTDPQTRANIQTNAMRSGVLFQNLGSLFLELGRTIMTLRMGQTSAEALVNAGPAIFISASGPNPIMVQAGPSLSAIPMGTMHQNGATGGFGSGIISRNIDIHIRSGHSAPAATSSMSEHEVWQQPSQRSDTARSSSDNSYHQTNSGTEPVTREPNIRVVPLRTVVAIPARISRPQSDSSRGAVGLYYNLLTRVPQQNPGDLNGSAITQNSSEPSMGTPTRPIPDSAFQPTAGIGNANHNREGNLPPTTAPAPIMNSAAVDSTWHQQWLSLNSGPSEQAAVVDMTNSGNSEVFERQQARQEAVANIFDSASQFLRNIIPGEQIDVAVETLPGVVGSGPVQYDNSLDFDLEIQTPTAAATSLSGDAVFFSDLVRQIMPFIAQPSSGSHEGASPCDDPRSSTEDGPCDSTVASSRRDPPDDAPDSKRQKME